MSESSEPVATSYKALWKIIRWVAAAVVFLLIVVSIWAYNSGFEAGTRQGLQAGYDKGRLAGIAEGKLEGERNGYIQGYEDKTYDRPSKVEETEWKKLDENRHRAKGKYLYLASIFAIPFMLYWLPLIYFKDSDSKQAFPSWLYVPTLPRELRGKPYRYELITKVLFSVLTFIMASILLPGDFLASVSSGYINRVPNEVLVILTGVVFSVLLVFLIEFLTTRVKSESIRFWGQILCAGIFSVLMYQLVGSLASTHEVSIESAIKMLLFQAGMFMGMLIYLLSLFGYEAGWRKASLSLIKVR